MRPHNSVCVRCSTGCSIQLHENQQHLYRVQPRYNPNVNDWWMCDIGRFENDYVHAPERINSVKRRNGTAWENLLWPQGLLAIDAAIADAVRQHSGDNLAIVFSPFLSCEEAFLLATYARQVSPKSRLVLGKVPIVGEDESFKKGFCIRAERCPNRRGVEAILSHFQPGAAIGWRDFLAQVESGAIRAAYVAGNYPEVWNDDAEAAKFETLSLLIVHDLLPTPLARRALFVVPGVSFAEKDGSYVNHAGLLQLASWGIRPLEGLQSDGQTFSQLLGRRGLFQGAAVLRELAIAVPFFARAADGVPEAGVNLITGSEKKPRTTDLGTVTHPTPTFRGVGSQFVEIE
jgi:NADH-quinone oxidoreductase subunit G